MVVLEGLVVLATLAFVVYGVIVLVLRSREPVRQLTGTRWRVTHYDSRGHTRVVLQRVSPSGGKVLDEHVVETIPADDPAYQERFLTAMATARERQALFEATEE